MGVEIDVTEGKIEPLPIAIVEFNQENKNEDNYSSKIQNIISNNLANTGLFKILPNDSFLQSESEVFFQPLFSDWRLIDANFLVSGKVNLENNRLKVNFKLMGCLSRKISYK